MKPKPGGKHTEMAASSSENGSSSDSGDQKWPKELTNFINRSFVKSKGLSDEDKLAFQEQIKTLLLKAERENKIYRNNWTKQNIPILDKGGLVLVCDMEEGGKEKKEMKEKKEKKNIKTDIKTTPLTDDSSLLRKYQQQKLRKQSPHIKNTSTASEVVDLTESSKRTTTSEYDSNQRKKQRLQRFSSPDIDSKPSSLPSKPPVFANGGFQNNHNGPIVGRCTDLEKKYYRLTSEPDPNKVRPQPVLQKSVQFLIDQLDVKPYSYIKDQFKSIRQDMTVQHLKNNFTLYVYETNSRISIKNNDLGEFNQCLTQMEYLFDSGELTIKDLNVIELEFRCYRNLYLLIVENHSAVLDMKLKLFMRNYTSPLELAMLNLTNLSFSLQLSMIEGDYFTFFKIVDQFSTLDLAYHLINMFIVEKCRIKFLHTISKAYRKIPNEVLTQQLGFKQKSPSEFNQFLANHGLQEFCNQDGFDCSSSRNIIATIIAKTNFKKIDIKGQV